MEDPGPAWWPAGHPRPNAVSGRPSREPAAELGQLSGTEADYAATGAAGPVSSRAGFSPSGAALLRTTDPHGRPPAECWPLARTCPHRHWREAKIRTRRIPFITKAKPASSPCTRWLAAALTSSGPCPVTAQRTHMKRSPQMVSFLGQRRANWGDPGQPHAHQPAPGFSRIHDRRTQTVGVRSISPVYRPSQRSRTVS